MDLNLNIQLVSRELLKSKSKNKIFYLEIELNKSFKIDYPEIVNKDSNHKYVPVSDYPSSNRDLSFSIKDFSKRGVLEEYFLNFEDEILKKVFIFDYYYNEKNSEIKIGFRFIFQSKTKTITDDEIDKVMNQIVRDTISIDGIIIPGLD